MRIVIEHDTAPATSVAPSAMPAGDAENAGGAPDAAGAGTAGDENGGGPPRWLLDAVGRAMTADEVSPETMTGAVDGGSAPDQD